MIKIQCGLYDAKMKNSSIGVEGLPDTLQLA